MECHEVAEEVALKVPDLDCLDCLELLSVPVVPLSTVPCRPVLVGWSFGAIVNEPRGIVHSTLLDGAPNPCEADPANMLVEICRGAVVTGYFGASDLEPDKFQ